MRGLLADVNVQGHLAHLGHRLEALDLRWVLAALEIEFVTFADLELQAERDDRSLWNRCQQDGWVLFTENRNDDGPNSLEAALGDSWRRGHLPLFSIAQQQYCDRPRIYVPL